MKKNLLRWKSLSRTILLVALLFTCHNSWAQNSMVEGTVIDAQDGEAIIGALVKIVGTNQAVACDVDGKFNIEAPKDAQLLISFVGYKSQTIAIDQRNNVGTIALEVDAQLIEQVIVTGYGGTTSRSKSTASIASVPNKVLETGAYSNPSAALAGAVPGLAVKTTSGRPGAVSEIILRGGTNLSGGGSPLVIVDGQIRGSLSDINSEDIADMQVLKDAAATAIYGARANNGVILITSKKGKSGKTSITASVKVGMNYLQEPVKMVGARDYIAWTRRAQVNTDPYAPGRIGTLSGAQPYGTGNWFKDAAGNFYDGNQTANAVWSTMYLNNDNRFKLDQGWQWMIDPVREQANPTGNSAMDTIIFNNFMVEDVSFNTPALTEDYNLSVSGGNDKGSYFASIGYYNEQGLPVNTFYNRLSFLFNGDYQIAPWLKSESSFAFVEAKWRDVSILDASGNALSEGNYFGRIKSLPPTMREYNEKGELLIGRGNGDDNPNVNDNRFVRRNVSDKFTISQAFKVTFHPNVNLRINAIWMYDENHNEAFNRDYLKQPGTINRDRSSSAKFDRVLRQTYNAVLNYSTNFGKTKHHFDGLLGMEYYDSRNIGLFASGSLAPTDEFMDLSLTSTDKGKRGVDSWHSQERIMSFLGRLNYDYDSKYLITFTFREDGYSRLVGNNRWGFFPGVSAAWVLSREDWMRRSSGWLNFLKLRASYGQNGNVGGIGTYELQGSYSTYTGTNAYLGNVGYLLGSLPAPNLRWEKSSTFEIGVDAGFLDGRINFSLAYYNRLTSDLIADIELPATAGITKMRTNNGSVGNQGIEVSGTFVPIKTKDWNWSITANLTWNKNRVVSLPYNGEDRNRQGGTQIWDPNLKQLIWVGGTQEGLWGDEFVGYNCLGMYRTDEDLKKYGSNVLDMAMRSEVGNADKQKPTAGIDLYNSMTAAEKAKVNPYAKGDLFFEDIDGNDTIDTRDRKVLGRTTPKIYGGLSTTLTWRNLTLYVRTDFALGHVQFDYGRSWYLGNMQGTYGTCREVNQSWTPENPNAKYPINYWADQLIKNNYRTSSFMTHNASYLALREVSLSYSFPEKLISQIKMQNLTLGVTAQNLGYITAVQTNYGPEIGGNPGTYGAYQLPLTIIFSAKITF
ncbi:MAG: SusC/RagA family TonB-linked outer membrane protein [Mucinivorans sp.]